MKMQKLVYISHGWKLGITGESLIPDEVMAWKYGPVIERLWHQFKEFGHRVIDRPARLATVEGGRIRFKEPRLLDDDGWTVALIGQIWKVYGAMSATQLSRLTHQEGTPWYTVAKTFDLNLPQNAIIPRDLIREHYELKWKQSQASQPVSP